MIEATDGIQVNEERVNYLTVHPTRRGDKKVFIKGSMTPDGVDFLIGLTADQAFDVGLLLISASKVVE